MCSSFIFSFFCCAYLTTLESKVIILSTYLSKARNANSSFKFSLGVFIIGTTIAYSMQVTMKLSGHRYDLSVKGQGHSY